jgi:hypothetical protein
MKTIRIPNSPNFLSASIILAGMTSCHHHEPDIIPYVKNGKAIYSDNPEEDGLIFRSRRSPLPDDGRNRTGSTIEELGFVESPLSEKLNSKL